MSRIPGIGDPFCSMFKMSANDVGCVGGVSLTSEF